MSNSAAEIVAVLEATGFKLVRSELHTKSFGVGEVTGNSIAHRGVPRATRTMSSTPLRALDFLTSLE